MKVAKRQFLKPLALSIIKKDETGALYGVNIEDVKPTSYVPKGLKSNFTGDITVQFELELEVGDKEKILAWIKEKTGWKVVKDTIGKRFTVTRGYKFENSDYKSKIYTIGGFSVKTIAPGSKKLRQYLRRTKCGIREQTSYVIVSS